MASGCHQASGSTQTLKTISRRSSARTPTYRHPFSNTSRQSETCDDRVWFRGNGVVQDQAQVLFNAPDRALDVARLIDDEVARRWPGREVLRLAFERPSCGKEGLVVEFSGSHVASEGGSAAGLVGEVRIAGPSDHAVTLRQAR